MSSFTPLVFSIFEGMSKSTAVACKQLTYLISAKRGEPCGQVISWIRIKINFALLKSSINAIRGYRSCQGRPVRFDSFTLANNDCRSRVPESNYCNYSCMAFIDYTYIFLLLRHNNIFAKHVCTVLTFIIIMRPYNMEGWQQSGYTRLNVETNSVGSV